MESAIEAQAKITGSLHANQVIGIRIEVDTDPPPNFRDETRFLLQPIPFSVRVCDLASLFAGKLHALLCRGWKNRTKGRDWYDLVWYVSRGTTLNLRHLESRLQQSGHLAQNTSLTEPEFRKLLVSAIAKLNIEQARADVERFLVNPSSLGIWSREFFLAVAEKISIHR